LLYRPLAAVLAAINVDLDVIERAYSADVGTAWLRQTSPTSPLNLADPALVAQRLVALGARVSTHWT
jgi:hypothetical protein